MIDTHFQTLAAPDDSGPTPGTPRTVEVLIDVDGDDGFHDEGTTKIAVRGGHGSFRFEIVEPERWWPAGMGEQPLYTFSVRLLVDDHIVDRAEFTLGLASVRRDHALGEAFGPQLLVNGRIHTVRDVVVVDRIDENQLLPATGESLLLVRDHYGYESLYDAADRAGILLIQSVPIDPDADPASAVRDQVDRLAAHPSLAGYFVGHLGKLRGTVSKQLRRLDPTRMVCRDFPVLPAA
ncbi:MAG: hypothetical protein AAF797_09830 [Planctomycetota bacterium]